MKKTVFPLHLESLQSAGVTCVNHRCPHATPCTAGLSVMIFERKGWFTGMSGTASCFVEEKAIVGEYFRQGH